MKGNSDTVMDLVENSYLSEIGLQSDEFKEELQHDFSPEVKPQKIKNYNFLIHLWKKLVSRPQSYPQNPNSDIYNIFEEETGRLASDSITSVLSKTLELPVNSEKVKKASEDSIKIFHEDYPGDFILEYKNERLGIMILDKCFDSTGEANLIYKFNPHIKSFRGLY